MLSSGSCVALKKGIFSKYPHKMTLNIFGCGAEPKCLTVMIILFLFFIVIPCNLNKTGSNLCNKDFAFFKKVNLKFIRYGITVKYKLRKNHAEDEAGFQFRN